VESIRTRLGANPIPLQFPIGEEANFRGVVDLLESRAVLWTDQTGETANVVEIPPELQAEADTRRAHMVEQIAELDEELTLKYLEGQKISVEELKAALRRETIKGKAAPVLCGSALKNKGVQLVLDAVIDYLPSPLEIPAVRGVHPQTGEEEIRPAEDSAPLAALVFKIVSDPYVGRLAYFRVYSGKLKQGSTVLTSGRGKRERVGRLIRMYADRREELDEVGAGDIAAVLGMKDTFTGDTLSDLSNPILLENITFPEPVVSVAIEPKSMIDQDKLSQALHKLSEEDPTFRVRSDETTGQTIISGMGELHLDVLVERMRREFNVHATVGRPRVAYRESITRAVPKVEYRYIKQSGGHGQYGHVVFALEPGAPGSGVVFENKIVGGKIPKEYHSAIEKGVRESAEAGVLAGYPVVDIKVTVYDGSFHEVDSNEMAFKMAATFGFREGVQKGGPVLLEPVMKVEVVSPEEYLGDVMGNLASRRANITGVEARPGNVQAVHAMVPLAEMFGYATELRSTTQGRGVFTMEFDHYQALAEAEAQAAIGKG